MLGLTADYFAASMGGFDLEHHLWHAAEVHVGDNVVVSARILAPEFQKLIHYLMFMVNGLAACSLRSSSASTRMRTSPPVAPFPAQSGSEHRRLHRHAPRHGLAATDLGVDGIT